MFVPVTFTIPPHVERYQVVWTCSLNSNQPIHIFATRVHGHWLSRENSVFYKLPNETEYSTLVVRSPQRPQSYYPTDEIHTIRPEHELVGRCIFNSMSENENVSSGRSSTSEMCNIFVMYYSDHQSNKSIQPHCVTTENGHSIIGLPLPLESEVSGD